MNKIKITKSQEIKISKLYSQGTAIANIAEKTGLSRCPVQTFLRDNFNWEPKKIPPFTEYQKEQMISLTKIKVPTRDVSKKLGLSVMQIEGFLRRNGLRLIRKPTLNKQEKESLVKEYLRGRGYLYLQNKYKISHEAIKEILNENGEESRPCKLYSINENYFDVIDTHEKAYFIGYIMADGCVTWNRPKTKISKLHLSIINPDREVLERFNEATESSYPIKVFKPKEKKDGVSRSDNARMTVSNINFVTKLTKYGIEPNKSLTHSFFQNIPEEFIGSAILGYFDGDGSCSWKKQRNKTYHTHTQIYASMVSTKEFAEELKLFVEKHGISCSIEEKKTKNAYVYITKFHGNRQCLKLYKLMTSGGVPSLKRKRAKFEHIIKEQIAGNIIDTNGESFAK